jgi:transposase
MSFLTNTQKESVVETAKDNKVFLCLIYNCEIEANRTEEEIVGVDRGIYSLAPTSKGKLFGSNHRHGDKRKYAYSRKTLQSKGV